MTPCKYCGSPVGDGGWYCSKTCFDEAAVHRSTPKQKTLGILGWAVILLAILWVLGGKVAHPQTRISWTQIRTCKNWDQPGTKMLLRDVAALSTIGPDLTIRVPGYAPVVIRITKAGVDTGNAHATSTVSIELLDATTMQVRMSSGAEVVVVSGPAVVAPNIANGYSKGCDSGYYASYGAGQPVISKWEPRVQMSVHACGFAWRLNGSKPAGVQACWHGVPVPIKEPIIFTYPSEVYKNATGWEACDWNSVCPVPRPQ